MLTFNFFLKKMMNENLVLEFLEDLNFKIKLKNK